MAALREDWRVLQGLFPAGWEELGRSSGAVARLRGFDSLNDVFRTLLMHVGCGWSLRETAVQAKLAGIADVSDVTLLNRLRQSEDWLRQLCQELFRDSGVSLEPALKGLPVRVVDATVVKEPGKTGGQWRIHYSMRLPLLECDQFELTPAQGRSTGEKLGRFKFQKGELILADAGYCNPPGIASVVNAGADVCVRLNRATLHLEDEKDRPFPVLKKLKPLRKAGETAEWQVSITSDGQRITGRLCGIRKSEEAIRRARRRLVIRQQDGRGRVTPENEEYACYVLVFTTLAKSRASAAQVLECYRLRWQIELVFKRLKSLVQLGHVPKHDDQSSRAWLYGKLFVALLSQKLTRVGRSGSPWGYYLPQPTAPPEPMA